MIRYSNDTVIESIKYAITNGVANSSDKFAVKEPTLRGWAKKAGVILPRSENGKGRDWDLIAKSVR